MTRILLVDDDEELVDVLSFALRRAGFTVLAAFSLKQGLETAAKERPDLVLLDLNLGSADGFDLLAAIRRGSDVPVILLTGRDAEDDKVRGLELGADDYVTKPFSHRELVARIRAHLRRHGIEGPAARGPAGGVLRVGPLAMNVAEHSATKEGRPLDLTVTEFRLLHYLMVNAGTVVPNRVLLKQVWGYDTSGGTDVVRVTVYRLRRKLEERPDEPRLLHSVPGVGVMLKGEPLGDPRGT